VRWFASYWVTVLICFVTAVIYVLIGLDVGPVGDRLDWLLPGGIPTWWTIPVLVAACYAVVRVVLHRVVAYTESGIEASPRSEGGRGRRRAALGNAVYTAFGNPTGWWLAPFAAVLGLAAAFATVVRWTITVIEGWQPGGWDLLISLLLAFAILYALTVTSAMLFPDRPQPLRLVPELEPDPVLNIPDGDRPAVRPTHRRFGRSRV
jgi:hypothetical protein